MLDKKKLRIQQKERLVEFVGVPRQTEENNLRRQLFHSSQWQQAQVIAVVLSTAFELDTQPIIQKAWDEHKMVVVPKIMDHQMQFIAINADSMYTRAAFDIKEPTSNHTFNVAAIDLVIVPGLAYTISGQRLGFGAGYYDRFLAQYTSNSVALALSVQMLAVLPVEQHDQKVAHIITV